MPDTDRTDQDWVQGWGLIKGQPPNCECAGMYETLAEAEEAAATAREGFHTIWGRYNERTKQFVGGAVGA